VLSNLTLNDASGNPVTLHEQVGSGSQAAREVVTAQGLWGIPTPRSTVRKRPTGHGEINETRWSDGSKIAVTGQIASQVSIDAVWADFYTVTAPMVQTLDVGPALLKWTNGVSGAHLQKAVVLDGEVDPVAQEGAALIDYQASFHAPDPRAYSQTLDTVTSPGLATAAGGIVFTGPPTLINPGFETGDTTGWLSPGKAPTIFAAQTGWANSGTYSARLTGTNGSGLANWVQAVSSPISVMPGRRYSAWAHLNVLSVSSQVNVGIFWYDANGTFIEGVSGNTTTTGIRTVGGSDKQAPALAATARVAVNIGTDGGSADLYIDDAAIVSEDAGGMTFPIVFNQSSGGVATCTNVGNRPTPCIFRIYGYCQAPQLILLGSGNRISLANGTIAAGDFCDVIVGGPDAPNLVTKSVLYNGTDNRLNFLDSPNTTWFELPKGSSSVQLIASAFDGNAKLSVMSRAAYA